MNPTPENHVSHATPPHAAANSVSDARDRITDSHTNDSVDLERDLLFDRNPQDQRARDIAIFEAANASIIGLSQEIGMLQGRETNEERRAKLIELRELEISAIQELQERYSDIAPGLREVIDLAEQRGIDKRIAADRACVEMSSALRGAFVSVDRLIQPYRGRSEEELRLIRDCFQERYGCSIEETMRDRIGGILGISRAGTRTNLKLQMAVSYLEGRQAEGAAHEIYLNICRRSAGAMKRFLGAVQGPALEAAEREFLKLYGRKIGARSLDEAIQKRFKSDDSAVMVALRRGTPLVAEAIALNRELGAKKVSFKRISDSLANVANDKLPALLQTFHTIAGVSLGDRILSRRVAEKPDIYLDMSHRIATGDATGALAVRLHAGIKRMPGEWAGQVFIKRGQAERKEIIQRYEEIYGTRFWSDLKAATGGSDHYYLMARLVTKGQLSPAEYLRDCMIGLGTDEDGIRRVLKGKSAADLTAIEKDYAKFRRYDFADGFSLKPLTMARHLLASLVALGNGRSIKEALKIRSLTSRSLGDDLRHELAGEDWRDIKELLKGAPRTPLERFAILSSRYEYERSGRLNRLIDKFTREGAAMDRDFARLKKFYEEKILDKSPSHADLQRFETLMRYTENAFDSFRGTKHSIAFTGANLFSAGTSTVATLLVMTLNQPLIVAMVATGLASLAGRVLVKWGLNSEGYGREEFAADLGLSVIDGATLAVGKIARVLGPVGRKIAT
jgi:hypothetical protein